MQRTAKSAAKSAVQNEVHPVVLGILDNNEDGDLESHHIGWISQIGGNATVKWENRTTRAHCHWAHASGILFSWVCPNCKSGKTRLLLKCWFQYRLV
jgi:hypothetical protein